MLINPVKTKSTIITTRQKHQLLNVLLRLPLDGQTIENGTERRLLGLTADDKLRWQAQVAYCFHVCYFRFETYMLQNSLLVD